MIGRVKLHRKMKHREWYTDANPARLFFHCLINANHKQKTWRGVEIKRGQFVTSSESLAVELGLSRQQIRTAIDKLVSTNEITSEATNTYTIITVLKYCDYQGSDDDEQPTNQPTKQQTDNQPDNQRITTTKEGKEYKNEKEYNKQDNLFDLSDDDRIIIDYLGRYSKDPNGQYKLLKDYCKVNGLIKTVVVGKETINRDGDIPLVVNKKEDRIDYGYIHGIISSILARESGGNKIKNGLQTIYTFITKNKGKPQNK